MRFGGYILEVLVNDVPLTERPVKIETEHINFEPSYYVDDNTKRKIFCDMHYIVETKPKTEFKIRFRSLQVSKTKIIRGDVAINGETDQTCIEMHNKSFQIVNGFWLKKKYKPFKFPSKFNSTTTTTTNNNNNDNDNNNNNIPIITKKNHYHNQQQFGGPNTISVYFYEIEKLKFPKVRNLKITSNNYNELFWNGSSNLKSYEPIAVLHIHYRSTSWFNLLNNNNNRSLSKKVVVEKETFIMRKKRKPLDDDNDSKILEKLVTPSIPCRNKRRRFNRS